MLSVIAAAIFVAFDGRTGALIPLYAIGVFLAFTLSQAGMVVHWWRRRAQPHWRRSLASNAAGTVLSALVFVIASVTKFTAGGWVAVLAIGLFILFAARIRRHYDRVREQTMLHPHATEVPKHKVVPTGDDGAARRAANGTVFADDRAGRELEAEDNPNDIRNLTVVPIAALDLPGLRALAYAASLQQPLLGLHISPTEAEAERFRGYWNQWGNHLPLEIVVSPHRALVAPMVNYLSALHGQRPDLTLTVILPEIVVRHRWQRILHNRVARRVRRALQPVPKIVVATVPFHLAD